MSWHVQTDLLKRQEIISSSKTYIRITVSNFSFEKKIFAIMSGNCTDRCNVIPRQLFYNPAMHTVNYNF